MTNPIALLPRCRHRTRKGDRRNQNRNPHPPILALSTRDFGVRLALGAQPGDVFGLVIKEAAILCVGGIALGIGGAVIVTRWLQSELHGVSPTDPATYIGVAIAIAIVTLAACYAPTRRAMRVDPLIVLRED